MSKNKAKRFARRKHKVNTTVKSLSSKPRLIVNKSNAHMFVQIVDHMWIVISSAHDFKITSWTKSERAFQVWEMVAKAALAKDVTTVVFDRNWHLFQWRVTQVAEWAKSWWLII